LSKKEKAMAIRSNYPDSQQQTNNNSGGGLFGLGGLYQSVGGGIMNLFNSDPTNQRLASANLPAGGSFRAAQSAATPTNVSIAGTTKDWRIKLSVPGKYLYNADDPGTILQPLQMSGGVVFPYTPTISIGSTASYEGQSLTHSNYAQQFYNYSTTNAISISGTFTAHNQKQGLYMLAVIHFFRSATKMFYGQDAEAGAPPPILFLDGYGQHIFDHIPVVVTSFSVSLDDSVDYISVQQNSNPNDVKASTQEAKSKGPSNAMRDDRAASSKPNVWKNPDEKAAAESNLAGITRVPTKSTVTCELMPVYSRKKISSEFSLKEFAAGNLIGKGFV